MGTRIRDRTRECWAARRIALRDRLTDGVAIGAISTALRRSWLGANYRRIVRLTFALLPSPLLGPEAWGPVAEVLRSGGWSVLEQAGAAEPPGAPGGVLKRLWGDDLRGLYPDPDTRGRIEEQAPRIPVRYLRSTISLPVNWNRYPGAYLAFGDTYAEDRATALALGWPTATITGRHLHQLHQPDVVAERILALARQAGLESLSPSR